MNIFGNKKYFEGNISHGFVSLYSGKAIMSIGAGLLHLFLPLFLYNLFGQNFRLVTVYYIAGHLLYAIAVAFGAKFLNSFGFRRALRISVFLGALFYTVFYFMDKSNFLYLAPLSIFILVLYRLSYWLPYHVDFAKFTDKKNRGRQLSAVIATRMVISIFVPLTAGFLVSNFGFDVVFIVAIFLFLASGIPYLTLPHAHEKFSWGYRETWKFFFSKGKRKVVLAYAAAGAEQVVGFIVWPIFIFQLLEGNYFQVGAVSTFIIAVSIVLQLLIGKYIDNKDVSKERLLHYGSALYSVGWVIKIFISTAFHIFIVGAYHSLAGIFMKTPWSAITYEIAADNGHYVDEFTVLHEMAVNIGKTLMLIAAFIISIFFAIQWVFVLAAMAALLLNLLHAKDARILPRGIE